MARLRTFIGIEVPADVCAHAERLMKTMRDETESIRWVSTNNLHVTLKFLGDVEDREIYAICRAVNNAVQNASCFSLACRGVGAFPSIHQPRTIWVGIDDLDQELTTLFSRLESELSALGFPREPRRFKPHLTLGRVTHGRKNLGNLPAVIESMCELEFGWMPVEELTVFTSELRKEGPVYTVVSRSPLGG